MAATESTRSHDIEEFTAAEVGSRARISVNLFSEIRFAAASGAGEPVHPEFQVGSTGLIFTGTVDRGFTATMELVHEGLGEPPTTVPDLERVQLEWKRGSWVLRAGRMHTQLGYWNTAFHHGTWLQPTINRPRVLRFEDDGGLLPVHWVGIEAASRIERPWGEMRVTGGVSNGRGTINDDIRTVNDTNAMKALKLNVDFKRVGNRDLSFGAGAIYDRIAPASLAIRPALPDVEITEVIGNAYVAYRGSVLTLVAESFVIRHAARSQSWRTTDSFAVVGYTMGLTTPYASVEWRQTGGSRGPDPFYSPDGTPPDVVDPLETIFGVRYDAGTWHALKLEYRLLVSDGARTHTGVLAWAFGV